MKFKITSLDKLLVSQTNSLSLVFKRPKNNIIKYGCFHLRCPNLKRLGMTLRQIGLGNNIMSHSNLFILFIHLRWRQQYILILDHYIKSYAMISQTKLELLTTL